MKRLTWAVLLLSSSVSVMAIGCGSSGGGGGGGGGPATSGVEQSKTLASLSVTEKGDLCDWKAAIDGGYGKTMKCSDGTDSSNDLDQAACVADVPSCSLTVSQFEICMKVVAKAPICDQAGPLLLAPECKALLECVFNAAPSGS